MSVKTSKQYVVRTPCAKCPFRVKFRGDDDYLRPGRRAGIARGLLEGSGFPCHETINHADHADHEYGDGCADDCEDHVDLSRAVTCAGAALVMLRAGHEGPLKFAIRLGLVDVAEFETRNADVELWTLRECLDDGRNDDEIADEDEMGTCCVVGPGCEAPAGHLVGGEVVHGTDLIDTICPACGEFVCDNCSNDDGICQNCEEDDDIDW